MTEHRGFSGSFLVSSLLYVGLGLVSLSGLLGSLDVDLAIRICAIVAAVIAMVAAAVILWRNPAPRPMDVREKLVVRALLICVLLPMVVADAYFEFFRPH